MKAIKLHPVYMCSISIVVVISSPDLLSNRRKSPRLLSLAAANEVETEQQVQLHRQLLFEDQLLYIFSLI